MDPETLVTFLFKAPKHVRTVELLGSWDNFTNPYQMHHDRRRGTGFWSGCFKFENIIFDGDRAYWTKPRSGGLKQGGTYWYYYRLDYDVEAYDDLQPCTAGCPLMPGQTMNVIEVPTEIVQPPSRCRSACYEGLAGTLSAMTSMRKQTLEPSDKFAALEPPPVSKVHGRCISDLALSGRLEGQVPPPSRASLVSPVLSLCGPAPEDTEEPLDHRPAKRRCSGESLRSLVSRRSEHSTALSCEHASVVDAYAAEAPEEGPHPDPLRSLPVPEEDRHPIEEFHAGFDFELDGPDNDAGAEQHYADAYDTASVHAPASIHNVQMYGSPSGSTADEADNWRPRMYSLPSTHLSSNEQTPGPEDVVQPLVESSPPLEQATSSTDDDLCSPTFSAATVSSNGGGLNTPYRLSGGYSRDTTAYTPDDDAHPLDEIAERLQSLDATGGASAQSSPIVHRELAQAQATFAGYSLPAPAMESVHSLGKMSSPRSRHGGAAAMSEQPLPPALVLDTTGAGGRSMMDDILSELGYLGGSIA